MTTEKTVQKNTKRKPIHKQAGPSKDIKKLNLHLKQHSSVRTAYTRCGIITGPPVAAVTGIT